MEKNLTYESAFSELKKIAAEIEQETVSVDILAEKVKRASVLIEYCQSKLRDTELQVNKIIQQMEKNTVRLEPGSEI
jgi:exodeoxyribonuclease VII small subunit